MQVYEADLIRRNLAYRSEADYSSAVRPGRFTVLNRPSCVVRDRLDERTMAPPRAIVLRAPGTNCDEETVDAWERAGATVETWHVNRLLEAPDGLDRFQILTIPGGFSYGDDLGAGRILATRLGDGSRRALRRFHDRGGLVLGICNGFQVLVRSGLLPGGPRAGRATLTLQRLGAFRGALGAARAPTPGLSPFVDLSEPIELPVAHGEGKFLTAEPRGLDRLEANGQVVLRYADDSGQPTEEYPANPNGSAGAVAGVCDPTGRIFGLMPHPERHIDPLHHPRWTRRGRADGRRGDGLRIFRNAVAALRCGRASGGDESSAGSDRAPARRSTRSVPGIRARYRHGLPPER